LGPQVLAGLVIIIGLMSIIPAMSMEPTVATRAGDMPMMEAIAQARTPMWLMILNPIIGAIGALIGGNALKR
ncbi:MAG TPA: hypothetical protein VFM71_02490, partial [Gemmatimonadaceae bacterium]|nr:hypothetical protein [Gemmatimonadaceae bacterium]